MEGLRSTFYSISIISVAVGLIEVFSSNGSLKKHTKFIVSLVVICALLTPVKNLFDTFNSGRFDSFFDGFKVEDSTADSSYSKTFEISISQKISDYFSIPVSSFDTEVRFETIDKEKMITDIRVNITDQKYFYLCEKIEAYLKSTFGCNVSVVQYFGE